MSCSINRYKFVGGGSSGNCKKPDTTAAKEMEARMKEMMAVREAQDGGNFKVRPSWDTVTTKPTNITNNITEPPTGTELKWSD